MLFKDKEKIVSEPPFPNIPPPEENFWWQNIEPTPQIKKSQMTKSSLDIQLFQTPEGQAPLYEQINTETAQGISSIEKRMDSFNQDLKNYKDDLKKVSNLLIGVLIFVSVSFIVAFFSLCWNKISNDSFYYQQSSNNNTQIINAISQQKIQLNNFEHEMILKLEKINQEDKINDLDNKLRELKLKNSYLK